MISDIETINILVERNELAKHGYFRIDTMKENDIYENINNPKFRYLGHYVDDFCKYVRLTHKYLIP